MSSKRVAVLAAVLAGWLAACGPGAQDRDAAGQGTAGTAQGRSAGHGLVGDQAGSRPSAGTQQHQYDPQRWHGLRPLVPPPAPPARSPVRTAGPEPVVIRRVPTDQKVVFLTIDDGWDKDPQLVRFVQEFHLPVTVFLTDRATHGDYAYFRQLQQAGASIQNHTSSHPNLTRLPLAAQQREICGPQQVYAREFGAAPTLFRPPGGNYDQTTVRAAGRCGLRAVVLWGATLPATKLRGGGIEPGQIILTHFRPHLVRDLIGLLKEIEARGYTVARLEDYIEGGEPGSHRGGIPRHDA